MDKQAEVSPQVTRKPNRAAAWAGRQVIGLIKAATISAPPKRTPEQSETRRSGAFVARRRGGKTELVPYERFRSEEGELIGASRIGRRREQGVTGLDVVAGVINDDYNADMADLTTRMSRFEEMRRSDSALAVMENLVSLPVREAKWWVTPGDDEKFADRVWENLEDEMSHSFDELLRQVLLAPLYGFAIHEPVPEIKPDGFDGIRKFAERGRTTVERWDFDASGGINGFWQEGVRPDTGGWSRQFLDIKDLVVWTWRADAANPEGLGIYRQAYKHFRSKEFLEEAANIRVERTAIPIPVWTPPAWGGSKEDADDVLSISDRLIVGDNVGIVLPAGWTLTFEWAGSADVPWLDFIQWEHMCMLQSVLGQFVGFGSGGQTAGAPLSRDASSLFLLMMNQIANWVCATFNIYVMPKLYQRNLGTEFLKADSTKRPRLAHGRVGLRDLDQYGRAFRAFFDKNTLASVDELAFFVELMGMPPISEEELQKIVDLKASSGAAKQGGAGAGGGTRFQDSSRTGPASTSAENGPQNMEGHGV